MLVGAVKRVFTSGPAGPAGATLAAALSDVSAGVRAVLVAADLPAARAAFGLTIGASVQAWSATLDALAGLTTTAFGRSLLTQADAPTTLSTLGAVGAGRQVVAGSGLTGGGDLSQDRTFALAGIATGTLLANTAAGPGSAVPVATTATAFLDASFGSARGTIIVRGLSGWGALALGASGYTLQSNGTDLVFAASAPGAGALRYDAIQTLSDAQKLTVNQVVTPAPASVTASGPFAATDHTRIVRAVPAATAAFTRTLPAASSLFPGWMSRPIRNESAYVVTLAVASGDVLEGVVNGTQALLPGQVCQVLSDTDGFHVFWLRERPLVASGDVTTATSAIDIAIPAGYSSIDLDLTSILLTASVANLTMLLSSDGGATWKSGTSDFTLVQHYGAGNGVPGSQQFNGANWVLMNGINTDTIRRGHLKLNLRPGTGSDYADLDGTGGYLNSSGQRLKIGVWGTYDAATARINKMRLAPTAGNVSLSFRAWGNP